MVDELRLDIEITAEDLRLFRKLVLARAQAATARQRRHRRLWTLGLVCVLPFALVFAEARFGFHIGWSLDGFVLAAMLIGFFLIYFLGDLRELQRVLLDSADARHPRRVSFAFGSDGVRFQGPDREGHVRWSAVLDLDETPTHLFLMTSLGVGWILPKRQLPDSAAEALRRMVRDHQADRAG
jgi:hypothetical protein